MILQYDLVSLESLYIFRQTFKAMLLQYRRTLDCVCPCYKLVTHNAVWGQHCRPVLFVMGLKVSGSRPCRKGGWYRPLSKRHISSPHPQPNTPLAPDMQVRPLINVSLQTVQGECSSSLVFLWNMGRWNRVSHVNFVKK